VALLCAALAGGALAISPTTGNPSTILMGDTAPTSWATSSPPSPPGAFKSAPAIAILVPILVLAVPLFDTVLSPVRRYLNGSPFKADRDHLHHDCWPGPVGAAGGAAHLRRHRSRVCGAVAIWISRKGRRDHGGEQDELAADLRLILLLLGPPTWSTGAGRIVHRAARPRAELPASAPRRQFLRLGVPACAAGHPLPPRGPRHRVVLRAGSGVALWALRGEGGSACACRRRVPDPLADSIATPWPGGGAAGGLPARTCPRPSGTSPRAGPGPGRSRDELAEDGRGAPRAGLAC